MPKFPLRRNETKDSHHNGILVSDSPLHTDSFSFENAHFLIRFRLSSTLKMPKTSLQRKRSVFQKALLPKQYLKAPVFISVVGRFSVNDRKRIKKYNSFPGSLILPPPGASEERGSLSLLAPGGGKMRDLGTRLQKVSRLWVCYEIVLYEPNNMKQSLK